MAQTVSVLVSPEDRARLTALLGDRNRPLKHIQRARIILFSAERLPVLEVAARAEISRPAVWRWQLRYAEQGVDGLLRDKTRKPGRASLSTAVVAKVLALTCSEPPGAVTHWTGRAVAARIGISLRAVQRIWEAHRLQPHRLRTFKRSTDPAFAAKVEDVVGLYMDPPCHAVVLSIDEKSQIQALDRTQPGLPLKPGKCGTMTHDYKRNGTTTLFAALNILDGTVIGRRMPRHTHKEFLAFLKTIERSVPPGKIIHAITDNYATHKQPDVLKWLADHPRWVFHFTPTSGSWLNAVEGFFSTLTRRRLRRGVFRSVTELQDAIACYIREHNRSAKPFVWTASAQSIFDKLAQTPVPSE
ncbi:MAG: IS630 family transposase [Rhodospirillum sp.]|nr:IS630 family transposase [Rhodospirillum sp.]MCF8487843.1 IS630 family transposase [Rhodospirillum sp.]